MRFLRPRRLRLALAGPLALLAALAAPHASRAQGMEPPPAETLVRATAAPGRLHAGQPASASVALRIAEGWHVNANPPASENMIPTEVTLAGAAGVAAGVPVYPAPRTVKLAFDEEPLLVWDGEATVGIPLTSSSGAVNGRHVLKGSVLFQACNDQVCLAPARVPFEVVVEVTGGAQPSAAGPDSTAAPDSLSAPAPAAGTSAPPGQGFATAPPAAAVSMNPIADRLARGGWLAYLTIFLIGLALNLTPCVYPMLGVTVSIFGARRAAPPAQVIGMALIYVLGMALMYSALGLVAAFTGGLFGAFLQSPLVLIGIGVLMVALSLSMFGLYELQPPAWLLSRLGGAAGTSAAGVFLSGLVVGVFAAPCIGPPVVALLAVVGARADPWFGFTSFFTLAMGLGLPYLVLGTFSNLLQSLPRSGEWMVWVKKVFGTVLLAVGLFYALLALAPDHAVTVIPVTLVLGGLYLGFFERSAAGRRGFQWLKRAVGVAALLAGALMFVARSRAGIALEEVSASAFGAALADGRPLMVDFSADWCVPCHELEDVTFTDRRVIEAARGFRAFKVDLTRYDSPEAERWRKQYGIRGVPTVVFLSEGGRELRAARVEGFVPPGRFLEKIRLARAASGQAAAE